MIKELKEHKFHYLILFVGLSLGVIFYSLQSAIWQAQAIVALSLGLFYFLWGVVHHKIIKDLHFKIVLEYLLISLFACVILVSLILR